MKINMHLQVDFAMLAEVAREAVSGELCPFLLLTAAEDFGDFLK